MRVLNLIANKFFALAFSWLLGQRLKDTLCGTKVMWRKDYEKLNLKLLEIPIRYRARTYGETQISRFPHGILLLRMTVYAWRKLKAP